MNAPADAPLAPLERLAARARVRDIETGGRRTRWRGFGDGPPLVLLHGGHGSWLHWVRNIEALAATHTVWAADMPGYGDSDPPAEGTLEALADDLSASLDAVVGAGTPVSIAAFSFGALAATRLAGRRGGVERLALLGAAGHGGPRRPRGELRAWRDLARDGDADALADAMRHNLWVHMLHASASIDTLALAIHTTACRRTRFRSRPISRSGRLGEALARFSGPVMLAWGEHDVTASPASQGAALADGRAGRVVRVVDGAGHWAQYEAPEAVNRMLLDWFAGR